MTHALVALWTVAFTLLLPCLGRPLVRPTLRFLHSAHAHTLKIGTRSSPRKRSKLTKSFFSGSDDEEDVDPVHAHSSSNDPVVIEISTFESLPSAQVDPFRDSKGMVNEFKFFFSLRKLLPTHYYALFRAVAAHLPSEQNAEETFSLAGKVSNENTRTASMKMAAMVRITENRASYDPSDKEIEICYNDKYRKHGSAKCDDAAFYLEADDLGLISDSASESGSEDEDVEVVEDSQVDSQVDAAPDAMSREPDAISIQSLD
jgi:hypothetical protein